MSKKINHIKRQGRFPLALFVFLALWSCLPWSAPGPGALCAQPARTALPAPLETARDKRLWEAPYWRTLVHYHPWGNGWKSRMDDPAFFLADQGKTDPQAELEATVRAMFQNPDPEKGTPSPSCRFPARARWIHRQLGLPPPPAACPEVEEFLEAVNGRQASLVFASAFINSPPSMFGHTLLTIEPPGGNKLLSYAVNYSARTPPNPGLSYMYKGLFGLYRGYYSILPYYEKLEEYSDAHHRDLWEYPLNLSPEQVRLLLLHLYELQGVWADYFFLDENCSYSLLYLLDAARPTGPRLADHSGPWVTPGETVIQAKESGLVETPAFRPSATSRIQALARDMDKADVKAALAVARGGEPASLVGQSEVSEQRKRRSLDLASEIVGFDLTRRKLDKETYTPRYLDILTARAALGKDEQPLPEPARPAPPDQSHAPAAFYFGGGVFDGEPVLQFRARPAFHGLDDLPAGYDPGAQVLALDCVARQYPDKGEWELEKFGVLDIASLSPRDSIFKPVSWGLWTGFSRMTVASGERELVYELEVDRGLAWALGESAIFYGMARALGAAGGVLEENYALGIGGRAGLLITPAEWCRLHLNAAAAHYALGDRHDTLEAELTGTLGLSRNLGWFVTAKWHQEHGYQKTEAVTGLGVYF